MKSYKLLDEGFEAIKQKSRNITIGLFLFVTAFVLFTQVRNPASDLSTMLVVFPLTLVVIGFALYWGSRRAVNMQRERWLSYELLLDDDAVIRKQTRTPDVKIQRDEVINLQQTHDGSLLIKTGNRHRYIYVPASLDGYDEVKESLLSWQELEILSQNWLLKQKIVWISLAALIGFGVIMFSDDIRIVLPIGFLVIGFFTWSMIEQHRNSEIDAKLKRNNWIGFGLVIVIIVFKIVILLTG